MRTLRKTALTLAALSALALGGAALANATDGGSSGWRSTPGTTGARPQREPLASDVAAKVEAAALAKVPGATVLRTEAGGPYGTAYHAHIRTAAGTEQVVLVDASFEATAVEADRGRGPGRGGPPGGGDRAHRRRQDQGRGSGDGDVPGRDHRADGDERHLRRALRVAHHDE